MVYLRKSSDRGQAKLSWLDSRHTFSFGDYDDPKHLGFETLRVINEDWVKGGSGFRPHSHQNMEIMTYVVSGAVKHKDSEGNEGVIRPGELQLMSAGSGIIHSEMNAHEFETLHLLQIWVHPHQTGLKPSYQQSNFSDSLLKGSWTRLASLEGRDHSLKIHQSMDLWAKRFLSKTEETKSFEHESSIWVQVVKGEVEIEEQRLEVGDGLGLKSVQKINLKANEQAEILVFVFKK